MINTNKKSIWNPVGIQYLNEILVGSIVNPVENSMIYQWKFQWNANRNQLEIQLKLQWKSIGNQDKFSMKYQGNYFEIQLELIRNFKKNINGNPF